MDWIGCCLILLAAQSCRPDEYGPEPGPGPGPGPEPGPQPEPGDLDLDLDLDPQPGDFNVEEGERIMEEPLRRFNQNYFLREKIIQMNMRIRKLEQENEKIRKRLEQKAKEAPDPAHLNYATWQVLDRIWNGV